ncbi:MAG TPA: hypothetical protein VF867_01275 [Arthrobacter sp.]
MTQARVQPGIPAGGEFAATAHTDDVVALTPPPANPAAVLAAAPGTDKDPNSIPWPEPPARDGYVEVDVWEDAALQVLENAGYDEDVLDGFTDVYVGISLAADKEVDFYGVKANGETDLIAAGIREYEHAVDSDYHEDLRYRDGYENPMPTYLKAREEVSAKRLAASAALLAEAGVSVELEDLRRGYYRLKRAGAKDLELRIANYPTKIIETTNWHEASDGHYAALLDGDAGEEGEELLKFAATLVARDLKDKSYKALYGR